jgi:prolyl-tRNA editing enzyme YbaK/EbsC (Cys-tRNA(Pro) deacylase)
VQVALENAGLPFRVVTMPGTTRTAAEAAAAIGCTVAQIAKSILFRGVATRKPILVVASGTNRVNERLVALTPLTGRNSGARPVPRIRAGRRRSSSTTTARSSWS